MNSTVWANDSVFQLSIDSLDSGGVNNSMGVTETTPSQISDRPCDEALSSQTPTAVKLPGSLDALLYIVIVLMFYAFSIVILMVKYIRREREEASLRNYYHEFVSRDKFRSAQYKNRQCMRRIFGRGSVKEDQNFATIEEEIGDCPETLLQMEKHGTHGQTITKHGNTFCRLVDEEKHSKESFTFLGAKKQFCRNGFFGKKFCNKQLCSKCVSESSAPTIDWGEVGDGVECPNHKASDVIEIKVYNTGQNFQTNQPQANQLQTNQLQTRHWQDRNQRNPSYERDNSIFLPIMECDSEKESEDLVQAKPIVTSPSYDPVVFHGIPDDTGPEAIVSSCSLEVSELLGHLPPLGAASNSNDMDTLDGLSNLDSEAESQSLLNYSASMRGSANMFSSMASDIPKPANKSEKHESQADSRHKDFSSDFLSERTSLLSCTLSIDEDDDVLTNLSSKHHPNGLTMSSNSNGKVKDEFKSNGKSLLNSLSKSVSSDENEMMKLLSDITMLTEESGVFKNLKYFLRSFSRHEDDEEPQETSNLLPKETYFGPGSPKSVLANSQSAVVPTQCEPVIKSSAFSEVDSVDSDLLNLDECENYGNRWGYTYDEEDGVYSDGDKSSSFGEYCMGEASDSQVIDLSKPLIRRQFDAKIKDGLSRALIGLDDSSPEDFPPINKPNPMLAGYGAARKETKV